MARIGGSVNKQIAALHAIDHRAIEQVAFINSSAQCSNELSCLIIASKRNNLSSFTDKMTNKITTDKAASTSHEYAFKDVFIRSRSSCGSANFTHNNYPGFEELLWQVYLVRRNGCQPAYLTEYAIPIGTIEVMEIQILKEL